MLLVSKSHQYAEPRKQVCGNSKFARTCNLAMHNEAPENSNGRGASTSSIDSYLLDVSGVLDLESGLSAFVF